MKRSNSKQISGFTLIELIIIVVIIIILATFALVRYSAVSEKARSAEAYAVLSLIVSAENAFQVDSATNSYTTNLADLDVEIPASSNFVFEVTSADTDSGYASAKGQGNAQYSYGMCLKSAKRSASGCAVGTACNPGCP